MCHETDRLCASTVVYGHGREVFFFFFLGEAFTIEDLIRFFGLVPSSLVFSRSFN